MSTKYVLNYRAVPDFLPLAQQHGAAHVERLQAFHAAGKLLMAGPMLDPLDGDALAIFTSREALEEFVDGDPFVTAGVVASWSARAWQEALQP